MTNGDHSAHPSHVGMQELHPEFDARNKVSGGGLTKREYFAAMAMQGMCANLSAQRPDELLKVPNNVAQWAVTFADALINELNKTK